MKIEILKLVAGLSMIWKPLWVFVGLWCAPHFLNQEDYGGDRESEQAQGNKHHSSRARFVPTNLQRSTAQFVFRDSFFASNQEVFSMVRDRRQNPVLFRYTFVFIAYVFFLLLLIVLKPGGGVDHLAINGFHKTLFIFGFLAPRHGWFGHGLAVDAGLV